MATTQLTDVYVPAPFNEGVDEAAIELNAFMASGILEGASDLDTLTAIGGTTGELPFWNPLSTATEPNYSSDDNTSFSTPQNIGHGKEIYRKGMMNNAWSTMDLTRELALDDPLGAITRKIGKYWAVQNEKRVIQTALGVLADNEANDADDMLHDIYSDVVVGSLTAANYISAEAVIAAKQTMGDHADALSVIAMHSVQYSKLQVQNLIVYIPDARGEVNIPTYLGYRVVVDDSMVVTAGTNTPSYLTIMFAPGAFAYGNGSSGPIVSSEMERVASSGDGGGEDVLYSRRSEIIHPRGFQCTGTPAADTLTLAELATATTWDRVKARKNIGITFLRTN